MLFFQEVRVDARRRSARPGPDFAPARPSGNVLPRSSVAPVYRFLLMLRNGEAADPPAFLTEQRDWKPGDVFVAANERAFRILDVRASRRRLTAG
jgi:hypothetical protein